MSNIYDLISGLTAKCAVILARVSSKEQELGYSIDAQKHRLIEYCTRRGLHIIEVFEITESSTIGDRKKFTSMINFIKRHKAPLALVADKVDRLQRSFKEYPLLDSLVQSGQLELHFNTENYIIHKDSVSQERLMWSMSVIMAQSYIDNMKDNVRRSIEQKIRVGEWIGAAPIGYLNVKDKNGRSDVIIDPERALLVKRIFLEYSTGAYTIPELTAKAKNWGLRGKGKKKAPLSRSYIHKMINNPFYFGQMVIKGEKHPHRYEPLISKSLFVQCQKVLKGWNKKKFEYAKKDYIFRGLISCATTGKTVTADTKTKKYDSGKTSSWTYLRCYKPDNPVKMQWVREEKVLSQVQDVIDLLEIPEDLERKVIKYIRETDYAEREFYIRQLDDLNAEYKAIQARLSGLVDVYMDGMLTKDEYALKRRELIEKRADLEIQIKGHEAGDDGFKDALISLVSLSRNAPDLFKSSPNAQKRLLLRLLFANLELEGDKLLYSLSKPFDQFVKMGEIEKWRQLIDRLRISEDDRLHITTIHLHEFMLDKPPRE